MTLWLTLISIGLLTYAIRLSFILFFSKMDIPSLLQRALRFVPVAVLSAIIFPALFLPRGVLALSLSNARLLAGIIAVVVAWRTKNVFVTLVVGMGALYLLQFMIKQL
ncbi:MAG: AzlD domain-containing protein [Ktedonobacteraceae bacterium]